MTRFTASLILTLIFIGVSGCAALITPDLDTELVTLRKGKYTLDPAHSSVHFKVDHLGFSKQVGRFNRFSGSLDFDPENPSGAQLHALVDTTSIDFNNPDLEDTVRGASWLNTEAFPQAEFRTLSATATGENRLLVDGELTLAGNTAPLSIDIVFNGGANNFISGRYTLGFAAEAQLQRSNFGIDSFIGAVGDDVFLDINAEFLLNAQ
ncbi:MAG: YceI family protein [Pseudomonadota bacterium]